MSSVDLSKLIAQKKFLVPLKSSQLNELIVKQLEAEIHNLQKQGVLSDRQLKRHRMWIVHGKTVGVATFRRNLTYAWALQQVVEGGYEDVQQFVLKVEENLNKVQRKPRKYAEDALLSMTDNLPRSLHYRVEEENSEGCLCNVTCKPSLYTKLNKSLLADCDDLKIQDARMTCEEFLRDVFVGGLGGKEVVEERKAVRWELLTNDLNYHDITERVNQMLENATAEVLIMGYVGTHCLPKLRELKDKDVTIQAVTHRPKEMKSPVPKDVLRGFSNLVKIVGKTNISINPELHGRALIVDNKALIGSMDLNAHSLSGEHTEFAVYTEDVDTVRRMRSYFKKMFTALE